jgi:hypothetical protein
LAPLEAYEKIYVKPAFLDTEHGQIPCQQCHGGDPKEENWEKAHKSIVKDPTFPNPAATCGECHEEIAASAPNSLHYTLKPMFRAIDLRAGNHDPAIDKAVHHAQKTHCGTCHSSCGQCHVSRPEYVKGGFLAAHLFKKQPPMDTTCASCHGGRVHGEFTGANDDYDADVHYADEDMTCMDCHTAAEMHADAKDVTSRLVLPQRPACFKCHQDAGSQNSGNPSHALHADKVACQVCHAQANKNCFSCHVGTDQKGLPYYKCKQTKMLFKIGLNPDKTEERPFNFVVLRHSPADPGLFDSYVKNALSNFDSQPTWKLDTPHSIVRITERNKTCNNCHGKATLFLSQNDMADWERKANKNVIVPQDKIPKPINTAAQ